MRYESLVQPHVLREEGKEEEGPKARIWESDPALTLARVVLFSELCCRPSISPLARQVLSPHSLHSEDIIAHAYPGNTNLINGDQVPWLACKSYFTCPKLTHLK